MMKLPSSTEVKLWTIDVLKYMANAGEGATFSVALIAEEFKISVGVANNRLFKLRTWGMIKVCKQSRPREYKVTKWGRKFLQDKDEKDMLKV